MRRVRSSEMRPNMLIPNGDPLAKPSLTIHCKSDPKLEVVIEDNGQGIPVDKYPERAARRAGVIYSPSDVDHRGRKLDRGIRSRKILPLSIIYLIYKSEVTTDSRRSGSGWSS